MDMARAFLAAVAFICFPFAVVASAAALLMLFDRVLHPRH